MVAECCDVVCCLVSTCFVFLSCLALSCLALFCTVLCCVVLCFLVSSFSCLVIAWARIDWSHYLCLFVICSFLSSVKLAQNSTRNETGSGSSGRGILRLLKIWAFRVLDSSKLLLLVLATGCIVTFSLEVGSSVRLFPQFEVAHDPIHGFVFLSTTVGIEIWSCYIDLPLTCCCAVCACVCISSPLCFRLHLWRTRSLGSMLNSGQSACNECPLVLPCLPSWQISEVISIPWLSRLGKSLGLSCLNLLCCVVLYLCYVCVVLCCVVVWWCVGVVFASCRVEFCCRVMPYCVVVSCWLCCAFLSCTALSCPSVFIPLHNGDREFLFSPVWSVHARQYSNGKMMVSCYFWSIHPTRTRG